MENITKKRKTWSDKEINILIEFYSLEGADYCQKLLPERSLDSIKLKAQRLGILRDRYWTKTEIFILKENYPIYGNSYCQDLLPKRTRHAINLKASELKITAPTKLKSNEEYDLELLNLQSDSYRIEDYIGADKPILHECIKNHQWKAAPNDILRGGNCPYCAIHGFEPHKPAIVYYIKIDESIFKIGVTKNSVKTRFNKDRERIEILWTKQFSTGKEAHGYEQDILYKFREYRVTLPGFLKSGGNTELFKLDIMSL